MKYKYITKYPRLPQKFDRRKKISLQKRKQIIYMYHQNMSYRDIARILKISTYTVATTIHPERLEKYNLINLKTKLKKYHLKKHDKQYKIYLANKQKEIDAYIRKINRKKLRGYYNYVQAKYIARKQEPQGRHK
jgi:hypothetical protein